MAGDGVLCLSDAENFGPILTVATGDPADVEPEVVLELLRAAYKQGHPVGLDTEFLTDDIKRSGAFRAAVHVWSLGIPSSRKRAGGLVAQRVVLGSRALPLFSRWLSSDHKKLLYSAPADLHPLENAGITLNAWQDLLHLSRYLNPDGKEHGLKHHIQHTLGYRGMGEYRDNFYRPVIGKRGQPIKRTEPIPLAEIIPGHPLWALLCAYAALDAKATVELGFVWKERYGFRW